MDQKQDEGKQGRDWVAIVALWLGIASVVLWEFSIVPILAIGFSITALVRSKSSPSWGPIVGLGLGLVFLFVAIAKTYGIF